MQNNISITLEYKIKGDNKTTTITLTPDEYFDLDPDENLDLDCIAKYDHAIDYIKVPVTSIHATKLMLTDSMNRVVKIISEVFWNNGNNRVIERMDNSNGQLYTEIIIEVKISESPVIWEILRLDKTKDLLSPNYHGFITQNDDGSETETRIV